MSYRYGLLFLIALIWGSQFLFNHLALKVFTPESVAWLRAAIGFITLSLVMSVSRSFAVSHSDSGSRSDSVSRSSPSSAASADSTARQGSGSRYWLQIILVGFFEATLPFFLVAWGQQHVNSAVAAILMSLVAIFTLVLVVIFVRDEPVTKGKFIGIMLGFVGVVVLLWPQFSQSTGSGSVLGSLAILAAAMSFAVSLILIRRLPQIGSPVVTARNILFCGAVELGGVLLLMRQPLIHQPLQSDAVLALLAQGVLAGGVVYVLYVRLVAVAGATFAGFANYLVPIVGVFLGVVFLRDQLPISAYFSILILALAIFACEWKPTRLPAGD